MGRGGDKLRPVWSAGSLRHPLAPSPPLHHNERLSPCLGVSTWFGSGSLGIRNWGDEELFSSDANRSREESP